MANSSRIKPWLMETAPLVCVLGCLWSKTVWFSLSLRDLMWAVKEPVGDWILTHPNYPLAVLCEGGRVEMLKKFDSFLSHLKSRAGELFLMGELPYTGQFLSGSLEQVMQQCHKLKAQMDGHRGLVR